MHAGLSNNFIRSGRGSAEASPGRHWGLPRPSVQRVEHWGHLLPGGGSWCSCTSPSGGLLLKPTVGSNNARKPHDTLLFYSWLFIISSYEAAFIIYRILYIYIIYTYSARALTMTMGVRKKSLELGDELVDLLLWDPGSSAGHFTLWRQQMVIDQIGELLRRRLSLARALYIGDEGAVLQACP